MKSSIIRSVLAVLFVSATAHAQQAVQWRVEDGGNGHWYQWVGYGEFATWGDVSDHAASRGGHLATVTSQPEEQVIRSLFSGGSCSSCPGSSVFVGGYQDSSAADYSEPAGGWRWVTDEAWAYTDWFLNEPNNQGTEDFLVLRCPGGWNDGSSVMGCAVAAIIEWSADCNGDGIVDYGQILSGQLLDTDSDGVPDICRSPGGSFEIVRADPEPTVVSDPMIRAAIAATGYPWRIRDRRSGVEFLLVPPGSFVMGSDPSDPEAVADEMPAHQVTLTRAFYLGRTEVTQGQWRALTGTEPSYFGGQPNNPVERVSWNGAFAAATVLGYRRPTEAEWEYACRGGVAASRYGPLASIAWWGNGYGGTSGWGTNPVATKAPNGFGLYDMIGNVWEYCADHWGPYSADSAVDPTGPKTGTSRVGRSGDWYWPAVGNRSTYRSPVAQDYLGLASNGVRFALSPEITGLEGSGSGVDCNSDGISDAQQIARGELPDYNGNDVPDCCETGTACTVGNYPVQWRVADGGNGHWYRIILNPDQVDWFTCRDRALAAGGHLATITSEQENQKVYSMALSLPGAFNSNGIIAGPFLGGFQPLGSPEPSGGWAWVTGEPWAYSNWAGGQPDNYTGCGQVPGDRPGEHCLQFFYGAALWNDMSAAATCYGGSKPSMALEWSADCNGDGIVDYGQILSGQLADSNTNGIPDSCEVDPCPADTNNSGAVNGVDLAIVLGAWGTSGQGDGDADINNDGIVNGVDLAMVLAGWGPCP